MNSSRAAISFCPQWFVYSYSAGEICLPPTLKYYGSSEEDSARIQMFLAVKHCPNSAPKHYQSKVKNVNSSNYAETAAKCFWGKKNLATLTNSLSHPLIHLPLLQHQNIYVNSIYFLCREGIIHTLLLLHNAISLEIGPWKLNEYPLFCLNS